MPFDWETVYVDLHRPEEIMPAGAYKGLEKDDPSLRGLRLSGFVADMKRASQPPGRRIWLGPVRFVKKAVDLDWDQRQAPYTGEKGKDLVFRYPLTVTNRLDRELTVRLTLVPLTSRARHGETVAVAGDAEAGRDEDRRGHPDVCRRPSQRRSPRCTPNGSSPGPRRRGSRTPTSRSCAAPTRWS